MKPTTALSLLALAYATTVIAIPTPDTPGVYAVEAIQDSNTLDARDPMLWGPKKYFPFLAGSGYKRDVGKPDGQVQGQGHGFDGGQGHTKPKDTPQGMPQEGSGAQGPQGGQGGPQGFGQGQGMGGGLGQGKPDGGMPFGGQGKPE